MFLASFVEKFAMEIDLWPHKIYTLASSDLNSAHKKKHQKSIVYVEQNKVRSFLYKPYQLVLPGQWLVSAEIALSIPLKSSPSLSYYKPLPYTAIQS